MSTTRLKKKDELRYRKGSTCETMNCLFCRHFVRDFPVRSCGDGRVIDHQPRCRIMGLEHSRRYRVRPDYTCDAQETTYEPPKLW